MLDMVVMWYCTILTRPRMQIQQSSYTKPQVIILWNNYLDYHYRILT
jgi:hypothetical protein